MQFQRQTERIDGVELVSETSAMMREAASMLLASLSEEQKSRIAYPAWSIERMQWSYLPGERAGLALRNMKGNQRKLALALLASGLSRRANIQALAIMSLENILRETLRLDRFNSEYYFITIFGSPTGPNPWAWRFEGHHISVNCLMVDGDIAVTPNFLGANPACILEGPASGFRVLAAEEDRARQLLLSLDPLRRSLVLIGDSAPLDVVTKWQPRVEPDAPTGLPLSRMNEEQGKLLLRLLRVYTSRMPPEMSDAYWEKMDNDGMGNIHFAWAGPIESGKPHYYRLHGPGFLIEYDNVQNDANHIHTVWRDFRNDWGEDILKEHYAHFHRDVL